MPGCGGVLRLVVRLFNRLKTLVRNLVTGTPAAGLELASPPAGTGTTAPGPDLDWWLVETPEVLPAVVAALGPRLRTGNADSVHRITCAYTRGRQAAAIRRGEAGGFSGPRSDLRVRYYVVLSNRRGVDPYYTRDYRTYLLDVKEDGVYDVQSISHGFASEAEVTAFVLGAGLAALPPLR